MMDAYITVSGNLGTDVEHRATDNYSRASFRLASTPRIRRGDDWIDGHTTWVNIECTNRLADNARDSLAKGDPVVVFGRLRTRSGNPRAPNTNGWSSRPARSATT